MKTLTAPEGKYLTQSGEVAAQERIMVKSVSGFGDLDSLYTIATDEQVEEWQRLQEQESAE